MRLLLLFGLLSRSAFPASFEAVEPHMGTLVRIQLFAPDAATAQSGFRAAFARIAELDQALSDYQPDSELNRLCRNSGGKPIPVSADLFAVLEAAQSLAVKSGGAFDVTIGPLTHLWRQARKSGALPTPQALNAALMQCGYRKLRLDSQARTAQLDGTDMQLDLGAIAKGYAADAALATLTQRGFESALVAISGDLAFSNPPPGQTAWKIGVDLGFSRTLELVNGAVSTSGASEQHLDSGGLRYSHIIDPASGQALTQDIRVTVIARRGLVADGLATALSVLGAERGLQLVAREREVTAMIAVTEGGHTRVYESAQVRRFVRKH